MRRSDIGRPTRRSYSHRCRWARTWCRWRTNTLSLPEPNRDPHRTLTGPDPNPTPNPNLNPHSNPNPHPRQVPMAYWTKYGLWQVRALHARCMRTAPARHVSLRLPGTFTATAQYSNVPSPRPPCCMCTRSAGRRGAGHGGAFLLVITPRCIPIAGRPSAGEHRDEWVHRGLPRREVACV